MADKKTALITGASTGIGALSAEYLARDGFDLVLAARRQNLLDEVAKNCKDKYGAEVLVVPTDMSKEEEVKNLFAKTKEKFGKLDFFFCNQGVLMPPKVFEEQTLEDFYLVTENNFKSVFLALVNSINLFKEQGYGNILVTGSSSGIRPESGFAVYSASKHAVVGLVKAAAIECGRLGIRINCICPGGIVTPMTAEAGARLQEVGPQNAIRRPVTVLMKDRSLGECREIAGMVSFMASDESTYMQGSIISIDAGITL